MNPKIYIYLPFFLFCLNSFAQNMQILYEFDQIPQTLMLNPGAEVDYNKHFGVPFLSNVYVQVGATNKNLSYNNIFAGTSDNSDRLRNLIAQNPSSKDAFIINQQIEFINAGLRLRNPNYYLSFGMYQEIEGFAKYPDDLANLYINGNDQNGDGVPEVDDFFSFDQVNFVGELVGVFHIGISKKVNNKLNIGGRFKLLSGSLNFKSTNNKGNYSLSGGNPYSHNFSGIDASFNSSGLSKENGTNTGADLNKALSGLFFFGGNFGMGIDLGFTYHTDNNITLTGSLLDLDFVRYSNSVTTYEVKEDFKIKDLDYFDPPEGDELDYWQSRLTDFYNADQFPIDTINSGYNTFRSPKINAGAKYELRNRKTKRKSAMRNVSCDIDYVGSNLGSAIGIQLYTDFKPSKTFWAVTGFYSRELSKSIHAKITYTYDQFSPYNIGLGVSTHIKSFNFYATADNLLALPKVRNSNYQSIQFGMNFIFNN